jgi:hypothetical protein
LKKLFRIISDTFEISPPATPIAIEKAENYFNFQFPNDYNDFLKFTNGLEGETSENYLVLWSAEELIDLNEAYHVKEFVQNVIIFGSDGGEDAYAFDTSGNEIKIIRLPFIGMGHIASELISDSFEEFLKLQLKGSTNFFQRMFR